MKEQREFFAANAPDGVELDGLSVLGPIFVLKLKWSPRELGRPLVAELWLYPDGSRILELSTKCATNEPMQVAAEARAFLAKKGVKLSGEQQTKTKTALEFFVNELSAGRSGWSKITTGLFISLDGVVEAPDQVALPVRWSNGSAPSPKPSRDLLARRPTDPERTLACSGRTVTYHARDARRSPARAGRDGATDVSPPWLPPGPATSRPAGAASRPRRRARRSRRASSRPERRTSPNRDAQIDLALFTQWVDAYARRETKLTDFYERRFRAEFKPAFDAWVKTKPRTNPEAPLSPFAMPEYRLDANAEADRLEAESAAQSHLVKEAIQRADNYLLAVVLFAASLFFAGISTRLHIRSGRMVVLGIGWALFIGTVIWIGTFPVNVSA